MQQIFPDQLPPEPEFYLERIKKPGSMPAPEGGFPRFEGYEVVSVQIREATITATNDANAHAHAHSVPFVQTTDAYVYEAPPPRVEVSPYVQPQPEPFYQQAQPLVTPGMPLLTTKPRKRLAGRDVAIWICVAQLGVIIWWLLGPAMEQRSALMLTSAATWPTQFGKMFDKAKAGAIAIAHVTPSSVKKPPKGGKKPYARGGKGFVPPPPPEMASGSHMVVPPPPVAYKIPAGAVAASTLASPPASVSHTPAAVPHDTLVVHEPEEILTPNTVPSSSPLPPPRVVEPAVAEEPAMESIPLPVPEFVQKIPVQPDVWTVLSGNRKRTITER